MKIITKQIHAYLDYPVAVALISLPFVLGLGSSNPAAFYLSVVVGIAAFVLTILTDHHLGVIKIIPYKIHLWVDGLVGGVFLIAPFLLSFEGLDFIYYLLNGVAVIAVVSLHKPTLSVPQV